MRLLLLIIILLPIQLWAQNPAFDPEKSKGSLYEYASYVNVADNQFSVTEVQNNSFLEFEELTSDNQSFGFTTDNFWVRFKLQNSSSEKQTYYLETARPVTDFATLYQIDKDKVIKFRNGDRTPFAERQVKHRATIFKFELPASSTQSFYLQVNSDGETINLPLNLYSSYEFFKINYNQQLFLGLFYGLLCLAGLIYFFFFSSLGNKTFLYYGLYVFSIVLLQAALDGMLHQYIFTDGGYLNSRMVLITGLFSNFFLLKYCESFLEIGVNLKRFKKVYSVFYLIIGVLFLMIFISPESLALTYPLSNINGLFSLLLILISLGALKYKRIPVDPYFSIGIFFLIVGLAGFVMNNLGLVPNNFITLNSAKFGTSFEVIFLSLSMTNLIRKLRLNNEKSQELALQKSEEISELKTYFMSNMSHELRTPLNAIMGVVENELEAHENNEKLKESLEIIKGASFSLLSNVNDILDFERIENQELSLDESTFDPKTLLRQLSKNWSVQAESKGLKFILEIDNETPDLVLGDSQRFIQIINNVLANAVKFTITGSIKLKLKCFMKPDSTCQFSFKISDTGVGIEEDYKETLFSSFNQMRHNHKRQFGGIGLGLTIVKHLVDKFNGTITIDSEAHKGTDVFIELPLKLMEESTTTLEESEVQPKPLHILLVEDNKLNQLVMKKMFNANSNFVFRTVNNGQEALDMLSANIFDVVLMDLQMPVMDGYEATKNIREGSLKNINKHIPIIAVTADATEKTKKITLELGMNYYMTKPVNKDLLFQNIYNCSKRNSNDQANLSIA